MRRCVVTALVLLGTSAGPSIAGEGRFDSDGVGIHYRDEGAGPPVVLIHGFTGSAEETWVRNPLFRTDVLPELAKDYRVIALDCRGHGRSDKPREPLAYGPHMADDVVRLLDHLGIEKAHVVGYSMGALIAGKLLVTHPQRLSSVTFGGGVPVCRPSEAFRALVGSTADSLDRGEGIGPLIVALTPAGEKPPEKEALVLMGRLMFAGRDQKALAAACRSFPSLEVTPGQLKANRVPVRFVYGSRDPLLKDRMAENRELLAGAEEVVIDGADHVTTLSHPEFLKALRAALAGEGRRR